MIIFRVGVVMGRLGLVSGGLVVVGALAGCGAQALAPTRTAGVPPATGSLADGGTPTAAVDAAPPLASVDAATDAGPVVRPARVTQLSSADLSTAEVLAADADGIYWVTGDNQLWMLPTGSDTPRQLAADQTPTNLVNSSPSLLARGNDLFWLAWVLAPGGQYYQMPLHRTRKTGGDVVLLANCLCYPQQLAADDAYLYAPQGSVEDENGTIVALPLDADPGTAPTPLVTLGFDTDLFSVAVDDQYVYWTTYPNASTIQVDEGPVMRGDKAGLLAGKKSYAQFLAADVSFLQPSGGELYFVYAATQWTSGVGRVDQNGARSSLPLPAGSTILVLDRWVVTADAELAAPHGKIYAAPVDAPAGAESVAVQVADDVMVAPVIGLPGLVFVDAGGHLLAVSAQDLGAAVGAGQP
jgi:hypothetical protein